MRPVTLADIEVAARVLMAVTEQDRPKLMAELITRATVADRHRQQVRRPHPAFGTGTLMSAAQGFATAPRPLCLADDELCAYALVVGALIGFRTYQEL